MKCPAFIYFCRRVFVALRTIGVFALVAFMPLLMPASLFSQPKNGNVWYFGYRAGIDFNGTSPQPLTGINMDSYEGCAIYCDDQGQPVFYTNGGGSPQGNTVNGYREGLIWNRDQLAVYNMRDTAGGGYSATQSSIILPQPGASGRYYVLTMDHRDSPYPNRGLRYFLMDENANGGLGGAIEANVQVFTPAVEALSATPMANGQGYWVVVVIDDANQFAVLPLTAAGFGAPLIQLANHAANALPNLIKIAPDGRHLACAGSLYRFNNADGSLDFVAFLDISDYSFTFSPSGRYLIGEQFPGDIVRYDVDAPDIAASKFVIWPLDPAFLGHLQLGPDGAIYVNGQWIEDFEQVPVTQSISIIRCPEGNAPAFERRAFSFPVDPTADTQLFTSLPNFSDHLFYRLNARADTIALSEACADSLILDPMLSGTATYLWSTGQTSERIAVSASGDYTLTYEDECGQGTILYRVELKRSEIHIAPARDFDDAAFCAALPLTLYAVRSFEGGTLVWSDGSTADSLVIDRPGSYSVVWTNDCGASSFTYETPDANCCQLLTANAFTPNSDGINDAFTPTLKSCDVAYSELLVYSRWGELVFQSYETGEQWDGSVNGRPAPSDVYIFTFRYKLADEEQERFEKGQIHLLR